MRLQRAAVDIAVGGALFRAPVDATEARILDLGTGTGIWAIQMAE